MVLEMFSVSVLLEIRSGGNEHHVRGYCMVGSDVFLRLTSAIDFCGHRKRR